MPSAVSLQVFLYLRLISLSFCLNDEDGECSFERSIAVIESIQEPCQVSAHVCIRVCVFVSASVFVGLYACCWGVCIQEDLTNRRNSNFLFPPVCVIQWYRPYASPQRSNQIGPHLPAKLILKRQRWLTGAVGAACTHRRTKPQLGFICHSEAKQHGCELDLGSACIMHSSMCMLMSAKERKGTGSTEGMTSVICSSGIQVSSRWAWPLFPVSR